MRIGDNAETLVAMGAFASGANHQQPGNPQKLAHAILKLADAIDPPMRVQLGSDTVAAVHAKNQLIAQEMAVWIDLSMSTDFEPSPQPA